MMRFGVLAGAVLVVAVGGVAMAGSDGSFLDGKVRTGDTIVIGDTSGDVYAFGGDVRVEGVVDGDVVVTAGTVTIGGEAVGDVLVVAGDVTVPGRVVGDLRVAGGQVVVSGDVSEDVLVAAGRLDVPGAVGEDLVFGAGQVSVGGAVAGDVFGSAGAYTRSGTVGGDETVRIDQPSDTPRRSPLAVAVGRFASAFLVGLGLLAYRRRRWVDETVEDLDVAFGPTLGWGLGFVASFGVVPIGTLVLGVLFAVFFGWLGLGPLVAVTLLGVAASWAVVAVVAVATVGLLAPVTVGTWIAAKLAPPDTPVYLVMAAGLAGLVAVGLVPVLGTLVGVAVAVLGGGAWIRAMTRRRRRGDVAATPETAATA